MIKPSSIVFLTGAGVSAESGVATFRDKDGIWAKVDFREVATPEGFGRDPAKVHAFYNTRRAAMARFKRVEPARFGTSGFELARPISFSSSLSRIDRSSSCES